MKIKTEMNYSYVIKAQKNAFNIGKKMQNRNRIFELILYRYGEMVDRGRYQSRSC